MNIVDFLEIMTQSIPKIEEDMGRPLFADEKIAILKGALQKWNEANPDNYLILPAEFNK